MPDVCSAKVFCLVGCCMVVELSSSCRSELSACSDVVEWVLLVVLVWCCLICLVVVY